jgi:hypothetical protein
MESDAPVIKRWPWLLGIACLGICEIINFVAISLAPVSIITPLGAFSIIAGAIFGHFFFGEDVGFSAVSGIGYITFGTFLMVANGPGGGKDLTVDEFAEIIRRPSVIAYFAATLLVMILLGIFARGNLYGVVGLASLGAGSSINLSKAIATFIKLSITSQNQLANVLPYAVLLVMAGFIVMQVRCLNLALAKHKSYVVNSVYFVMLTTMSTINASVLYGELGSLNGPRQLMFIAGGISVMYGVFLLSKDRPDGKVKDDHVALLQHRTSTDFREDEGEP